MRSLAVLVFLSSVSTINGGFPELTPTMGVKVTTPQKLSVSLGISSVSWGGYWGGDSGIVFRLEPGLAGGKVHLGISNAFSMVFVPVVSADICCSLMYTWNNPWSDIENDQTYAGLEMRAAGGFLVISAGVYRHVAGGDTDHDWVFSGGAGLGF